MPSDDQGRHKSEVSSLLSLFYPFVENVIQKEHEWESLEDLMEARASISLKHAFEGFGLSYEEAFELIRKAENLTQEEERQRKIVLAAFDNLVDFSVVAEYQMAMAMAEIEEVLLDEEEEDLEIDDYIELFIPVFMKYNDRYMRTENLDAQYAMIVAAYLGRLRDEDTLTYMTMGDERVRPWHMQYEGYSAPRSRFPEWLVPPIEHQCRCFLVESTASVVGSIKAASEPSMPEWFDRTFKESVAFGGRIFSDEHPYFTVDERHVGRLNAISKRIKEKFVENGKGE